MNKLKDESERELERKKFDVISELTDQQRDDITKSAQETLRAIAFGKWDIVFKTIPKIDS